MTRPGNGVDPVVVARHFALAGRPVEAAPLGSGHIHDTFRVLTRGADGERGYCLQHLNREVFPDLGAVMENIQRVTQHLREKVWARGGDPTRETLTLVPTDEGESWLDHPELGCWRAFLLVDGTEVVDVPEDPGQVFEAARAFARFARDLEDLPGPRLHETIQAFHHTPLRLTALRQAVREDPHGRLAGCRQELELVEARASDTVVVIDALAAGELPERVTHNDTKINNVLLDASTGAGVCVIDLDTVMPGSFLYDFGDAVRAGAATAPEDCPDLSRVGISMPLFGALARGWLAESRGFLTPRERELMPFSCALLTLEVGIRFLTDHLRGDTYFKTSRPGHNLDRARNQLRMVAAIEERLEPMGELVEAAAREAAAQEEG